MPIPDPLPVSSSVGTFMESADKPAMQTAIGFMLPAWTWESGDGTNPSANHFQASASGSPSSPASTEKLAFSSSDVHGADFGSSLASVNTYSYLVLSNGVDILIFINNGAVGTTGGFAFNVAYQGGSGSGWAGTYGVSVIPFYGQNPAANGTTSPVTSLTIFNGIVTSIS